MTESDKRRKPGRPKTRGEQTDLNTRVSVTAKRKLHEMAHAEDTSMSRIIERLIMEA